MESPVDTAPFLATPFEARTRSDKRYRRILSAAVSALLGKGATLLVSVITVPLTVRYLGAESYGLWITIKQHGHHVPRVRHRNRQYPDQPDIGGLCKKRPGAGGHEFCYRLLVGARHRCVPGIRGMAGNLAADSLDISLFMSEQRRWEQRPPTPWLRRSSSFWSLCPPASPPRCWRGIRNCMPPTCSPPAGAFSVSWWFWRWSISTEISPSSWPDSRARQWRPTPLVCSGYVSFTSPG